jgi:hypothetical protein
MAYVDENSIAADNINQGNIDAGGKIVFPFAS